MERRKFFTKLGLGSAAAVVTAPLLARGLAARQQSRGSDDQESQGHHDHDPRPMTGALASATVSFGAWQNLSTTPPGGWIGTPHRQWDRRRATCTS